MALDNFKANWKKHIDVNGAVKGMSDNRDDAKSFNDYYNEFKGYVGNTGRYTDENGQQRNLYIQPDDSDPNLRLTHAATFLGATRDLSLDYSNSNLESILSDAMPKLGDDFLGFIAGIKPKLNAPRQLVDSINGYRAAIEPLSKEEPDIKTIKDKMKKHVNGTMSMRGDEGYFARALQTLYSNNDGVAVAGYQEHIISPKKHKLIVTINRSNWKAYMKSNIGKLKKPEQISFYLSLYERLAK